MPTTHSFKLYSISIYKSKTLVQKKKKKLTSRTTMILNCGDDQKAKGARMDYPQSNTENMMYTIGHNSGIPYAPYSFRIRVRIRFRIRVSD